MQGSDGAAPPRIAQSVYQTTQPCILCTLFDQLDHLAHAPDGSGRYSTYHLSRVKFHHVGIATRDLRKTAADYEQALGISLTTDLIEDNVQGVRVAFAALKDGGGALEFIEPLAPGSPVDNLLRNGGGAYHVCFQVDSIDGALLKARDAGALVVSGPVPAAAFGGRRIAFIAFRGGSLIELLEE